MPPRKAAPARSPSSPPSLKITSPISKSVPVPSEKGSAFKSVKQSKSLQPVQEVNEVESIVDEVEEEVHENPELACKYSKGCEVRDWLEKQIQSRTRGSRRDQGDIFSDDDSNASDDDEEVDEAFDLNACEEACGVTPDEIIDFVWKYSPGVKNKFKSKRQLDYILSCEPKELLVRLVRALDEVEERIGQGMPMDDDVPAHLYMKASNARIWIEEMLEWFEIDSEAVWDINECERMCGVTPDEIIDFIWDYAPGIQVKFGCKRRMDQVLSCEPKDLLEYLVQALDEVAVQIGPEGIQ